MTSTVDHLCGDKLLRLIWNLAALTVNFLNSAPLPKFVDTTVFQLYNFWFSTSTTGLLPFIFKAFNWSGVHNSIFFSVVCANPRFGERRRNNGFVHLQNKDVHRHRWLWPRPRPSFTITSEVPRPTRLRTLREPRQVVIHEVSLLIFSLFCKLLACNPERCPIANSPMPIFSFRVWEPLIPWKYFVSISNRLFYFFSCFKLRCSSDHTLRTAGLSSLITGLFSCQVQCFITDFAFVTGCVRRLET